MGQPDITDKYICESSRAKRTSRSILKLFEGILDQIKKGEEAAQIVLNAQESATFAAENSDWKTALAEQEYLTQGGVGTYGALTIIRHTMSQIHEIWGSLPTLVTQLEAQILRLTLMAEDFEER